ncbi:MAG: barstar family protein [Nocardioidaceae bacterium]
MSGLAKVLAGHTPPGVYHWTSEMKPADVAHAVELADWKFVLLDTWQVEDKSAFFVACRAAFDFPEEFAPNFDAFADELSDVRGDPDVGVVVLWDGWSPLARADRHVFAVAVDVLADRVGLERSSPFVVLLRGPGPDLPEIPELDPHHL